MEVISNPILGSVKHQERILYHLLYSDFPEDSVLKLSSQHFTEERHKIIFAVIKDYLEKYKNLPNDINVAEVIKKKDGISDAQKNDWLNTLRKLRSENLKGINRENKNDFEYIKENVNGFIKVQELKWLSDNDIKVISETNNFENLHVLMDKIRSIISIGEEDDDPYDIEEFDETIYTQRYKGFIPTGLVEIDKITGGGLPKKKMGMLIAGPGVGKSTLLVNNTVNAFKNGFKVLHVIFSENSKEDIQLLVSTALTGISLAEAQKKPTETHRLAKEILAKTKSKKHSVIKIKQFSSSETTIPKLKSWILKYQRKVGYKFDQVNIDYIDEMISHKRNQNDQWQGEKDVVAAFLDMLVEFDISGWTATQAKKEAANKKQLELNDSGGSVAKVKKAQVVITIGRNSDDRNNNRATFCLAKSNISPSGHVFEDAIFDNSHMIFELPKPTGGTIVEEFDDSTIPDDDYSEPSQPDEVNKSKSEDRVNNFEEEKNIDKDLEKIKNLL